MSILFFFIEVTHVDPLFPLKATRVDPFMGTFMIDTWEGGCVFNVCERDLAYFWPFR